MYYSCKCSQLQSCTLDTLMYSHESKCDFMSFGLCPHVLSRRLTCTVDSNVHSCRLSGTLMLSCALTVRSHVGNDDFLFVLSCDITLNHELLYVCTDLAPNATQCFLIFLWWYLSELLVELDRILRRLTRMTRSTRSLVSSLMCDSSVSS